MCLRPAGCASYIMSQIPHVSLSGERAIDRLRRLKREISELKSEANSSAVPAPPPIRESQETKKLRPANADEYAIEDRNICLSFPPDGSCAF